MGVLVVMRGTVEGGHSGKRQGPEAEWFTDVLWGVLKRCWSPKPEPRPTVEGALERLEQGSAMRNLLSLSSGSGAQVYSETLALRKVSEMILSKHGPPAQLTASVT
jgi:hypothetical protein